MSAAMLALQAKNCARELVCSAGVRPSDREETAALLPRRHRCGFLQKLWMRNLVIGKRQPRPADGIAAGVEDGKSAPCGVGKMKVIDQWMV